MRKTLIFISLLFVAVMAVAGLYFSQLGAETRSSDKVLSYIPQDAALVLSFRNDKSFQDIFKDYKLFDALLGDKNSADMASLQNLLKGSQFAQSVEGTATFLSFHHGANHLELLWLMALNTEQSDEELYTALLAPSPDYTAKKIALAGKDIIELKINIVALPFYLYVHNVAAIGSFSKPLLQTAMDETNKKISKNFIEQITSANQNSANSLLNLFVEHSAAPDFFWKFLNGKPTGNSALLDQLSGYSALNMNFKSDALMFNGIAEPDTATGNYLSLLARQKPVNNTILKAFPQSTANYIAFGISNYKLFSESLYKLLAKRNELKKLQNQFALLKASSSISIDGDVKRFLSNEFAVLQLADQQKLAIIKLTNGSKMINVLDLISQPYSEEVLRLNNANIFYYCFGDPFLGFPRPFYTILDNYMILANSPSTLQQFLADYNNDKRLAKSTDFARFNQFIANQSNVSFFINIKNSKSIINSALKQTYANNFKDPAFGLDKFYGASYQWSADGGHFFTNVYASLVDTSATKIITDDGL